MKDKSKKNKIKKGLKNVYWKKVIIKWWCTSCCTFIIIRDKEEDFFLTLYGLWVIINEK